MIETGSCLCGSVSYSFQRNKPDYSIKSFNQNPNLIENIKTVLKSFI